MLKEQRKQLAEFIFLGSQHRNASSLLAGQRFETKCLGALSQEMHELRERSLLQF
jgi:hypothetical protein